MKSIVSIAILCTVLCGCYTPMQYPLNPGEKIIFKDFERAAEFRSLSGNDPHHDGAVVEITRPTLVQCE